MQTGKEGKVVGVELRQYALKLSADAMAKMRKNKEYGSLEHLIIVFPFA